MGYLDRAIIRPALLDISEDDDLTQPTDIQGYEIIAVITPDALDGATNDIDHIEIDPGNGTFYEPLDNDGDGLLSVWFTDMGTDQYLSIPRELGRMGGVAAGTEEEGPGKLVGARARLHLSEGEAADRTFYLVLLALPGSAD